MAWHSRAVSLSVLRPGAGLTRQLPSGRRSSSGPSHSRQDLLPATGLCWVTCTGTGARVPLKAALSGFLRLSQAQDSP